jgi:hypothetical protein
MAAVARYCVLARCAGHGLLRYVKRKKGNGDCCSSFWLNQTVRATVDGWAEASRQAKF